MDRIKKSLWDVAVNTPHNSATYCFFYVDKRVEDMLQIIEGFNTFAEIVDELKLFDRSLWDLRYTFDENSKFEIYRIVGNGFLQKATK